MMKIIYQEELHRCWQNLGRYSCMVFNERLQILAIILGGFLLRLVLFGGDGLGDDSNYFSAFNTLFNGTLNFSADIYHHRFSYWIPQLAIWKLFGISEFTFVLPVLLSSMGCIYVSYLLGKEIVGASFGLIAASLMAANPFEVLNATLISTDVNLSLYIMLSVYFFIIGQKEFKHRYFILSALFAFFAFVNKPMGLYVFLVLGIFYFRKYGFFNIGVLKEARRYWALVLATVFFFGSLLVACWHFTGNPFLYITIYKRDLPQWAVIDWHQILVYPKQMFFKNEFGEWLHGFHFYVAATCLFFVRLRGGSKAWPFLSWFMVFLFCLMFVPHGFKDGIPYTAQRIFRYFVIAVPPSVLFVAYFWNLWKERHWKSFAIVFSAYLCLSIAWCFNSTSIVRVAFGEVRHALKFLKTIKNEDIYADGYLMSKLERLEFSGIHDPRHHYWLDIESPEKWVETFRNIREGYVVTGGPRLPYYGNASWIPNLRWWKPRSNWTLVKEYDKTPHLPWKEEPLRIWKVSFMETATSRDHIIKDESFNDCLRSRVFPLRPEDGLAENQSITERLAYRAEILECVNYSISNAQGLEKLINLKVLNLSNSKLTSVDLSTMPKLEVLLMAGNLLTEIRGLGQLKNLRLLWVASNRLTSLDVHGLTALIDLRVDDNRLVRIDGVEELQNLQVAYLGGNRELDCKALKFGNSKAVIHGCP